MMIDIVLNGVAHRATLQIIRPQMAGPNHNAGQDYVRIRVISPRADFTSDLPVVLTLTRKDWASLYDADVYNTNDLEDLTRGVAP